MACWSPRSDLPAIASVSAWSTWLRALATSAGSVDGFVVDAACVDQHAFWSTTNMCRRGLYARPTVPSGSGGPVVGVAPFSFRQLVSSGGALLARRRRLIDSHDAPARSTSAASCCRCRSASGRTGSRGWTSARRAFAAYSDRVRLAVSAGQREPQARAVRRSRRQLHSRGAASSAAAQTPAALPALRTGRGCTSIPRGFLSSTDLLHPSMTAPRVRTDSSTIGLDTRAVEHVERHAASVRDAARVISSSREVQFGAQHRDVAHGECVAHLLRAADTTCSLTLHVRHHARGEIHGTPAAYPRRAARRAPRARVCAPTGCCTRRWSVRVVGPPRRHRPVRCRATRAPCRVQRARAASASVRDAAARARTLESGEASAQPEPRWRAGSRPASVPAIASFPACRPSTTAGHTAVASSGNAISMAERLERCAGRGSRRTQPGTRQRNDVRQRHADAECGEHQHRGAAGCVSAQAERRAHERRGARRRDDGREHAGRERAAEAVALRDASRQRRHAEADVEESGAGSARVRPARRSSPRRTPATAAESPSRALRHRRASEQHAGENPERARRRRRRSSRAGADARDRRPPAARSRTP